MRASGVDFDTEKETAIANLLPNESASSTFAAPVDARHRRLVKRLMSASALWEIGSASALDLLMIDESAAGDDLEELDSDVSAPMLDAFLDRIEAARIDALGSKRASGVGKPRGRFLLYFPGRSLTTGEAEISSRNFYDARDRPPISLWLETLTRAVTRNQGVFEVALLVFVPEACRARAEAGRAACPNDSLRFLEEIEGELPARLGPLIDAGS